MSKVQYSSVVKILFDEDGEKIIDPKWCATVCFDGANRTLCGGQCFGYGEGNVSNEDEHFKTKIGKITCESCRQHIKYFKSIKL